MDVSKRTFLEPFTIDELVNEEFLEPHWLVEGLLYQGGVSCLAALPKTGKSTLSRHLAWALSTGEPFLGRKTHSAKVLVFSMEESGIEAKLHFARLDPQRQSNVDLSMVFPYMIGDEDRISVLIKAIERLTPGLVIIDTLASFFPEWNLNNYSIYKKFLFLRKIAENNATHIILIHHSRKDAMGDVRRAMLGSVGISAAMDTVIGLEDLKEDLRIISSIQRIGTKFIPTVVNFSRENGRFTVVKHLTDWLKDQNAVNEEWLEEEFI